MIFGKYFLPFFLFSFLSLTQFSQTSYLDSLKQRIETAENDIRKMEEINALMAEYSPTSLEYHAYNKWIGKIILYNLKYRNLDTQTKKKTLALLGYWYMNKAIELFAQEKKEEVLACCDHAIFIFNYLGMEEEMWTVTSNKAGVLRELGKFDQAVSSLFSALKYHESINNDYGIYLVNTQLATIYEDQDDYTSALRYYQKLLKYQETIKDPDGIDQEQMIIDNSSTGACYFNLGNYVEAKFYFNKALDFSKEYGILHNISYCYMYLGSVYTQAKDYEIAEANFKLALKYAESDRSKSHLWQRWAQMYYQQKKYELAGKYFEYALSVQENSGEYYKARLATYEGLYKTYEATGQFKKAMETLGKYRQAIDSTKVENSKNAMAHQQLKYEYEKKELRSKVKQEERLSAIKIDNEHKSRRKNILMYALIFLALILAVSIFYLYKFFQQKNIINANRNNELKQKILLSQMNPHFIFNSVDNIQILIMQKQDEEAVNYLGKFSKLTRQILENSTESYITMQEELAMTENYLSIQRLLYNNKFTFKVKMDEGIDPEQILLPPMLTQPFIENAIKHGLKHKENNGFIEVHFTMKGESLYFEVTDNGFGLEVKDEAGNHRSMTISIVTERLKYYAGKKEIAISVNNRMENNVVKGVRSTFEIPYIYDK